MVLSFVIALCCPREAIHHTYIEKNLDLMNFQLEEIMLAENNFKPLDAKRFVKKNKKRFKIIFLP